MCMPVKRSLAYFWMALAYNWRPAPRCQVWNGSQSTKSCTTKSTAKARHKSYACYLLAEFSSWKPSVFVKTDSGSAFGNKPIVAAQRADLTQQLKRGRLSAAGSFHLLSPTTSLSKHRKPRGPSQVAKSQSRIRVLLTDLPITPSPLSIRLAQKSSQTTHITLDAAIDCAIA